MKKSLLVLLALVAILALALTACGGGGSDDAAATVTPVPTATPAGWVADATQDGGISLEDAGLTAGEKAEGVQGFLQTIWELACKLQGGCE